MARRKRNSRKRRGSSRSGSYKRRKRMEFLPFAASAAKAAFSGGGGNDNYVTTQQDSRVVYKRKRANKRFRRKAKRYYKFVRKTLAAVDHRAEKQKVLFVQKGLIVSAVGAQTMAADAFICYGMNGLVAGNRDCMQMLTGLGDTSTSKTKTYFRSCYMDISLTNLPVEADAQSVYVDVYHYICRKDVPKGEQLTAVINDGFVDSPTNMGGSTLASTTYGATLFQSSQFCEFFKIIKKTTSLLPSNGTLDLSVKVSRNNVKDYEDVFNCSYKRGLTRGVVVVVYGVPYASGDARPGNVTFNVTRTYTLTSNRPGLVDSGTSLLTA